MLKYKSKKEGIVIPPAQGIYINIIYFANLRDAIWIYFNPFVLSSIEGRSI